jgi:hypothetical protein
MNAIIPADLPGAARPRPATPAELAAELGGLAVRLDAQSDHVDAALTRVLRWIPPAAWAWRAGRAWGRRPRGRHARPAPRTLKGKDSPA